MSSSGRTLLLLALAGGVAPARAVSPAAEVDYRHLTLDFASLPPGAAAAVQLPRSSEKLTVLLTGGAGYIGSVMGLMLLEKGYTIVVVDNLSRGAAGNVETLQRHGLAADAFYNFDLTETARLQAVLAKHKVSLVIHFAANAFASESVDRPLLYFHNITQNTQSVLEAMGNAGVSRLIYSSSCATYGDVKAEHIPVGETTPQLPVSPYGTAKKLSEDIIRSTAKAYAASAAGNGKLQAAVLRYFNVIGADPKARVGPRVDPALARYARVADACLDAAEGKRAGMEVNGVDYLTPDGSVVRDYVHVSDLAAAHLAVLEALAAQDASVARAAPLVYNVGAMKGNSVKELAAACQRATGKDFAVHTKGRRQGDPPYIVGDARKIFTELGWRAQYTNLTASLEHMWGWRQRGVGRPAQPAEPAPTEELEAPPNGHLRKRPHMGKRAKRRGARQQEADADRLVRI